MPKLDGGKCQYAGSLKLLPQILNILREGDLNLSQVPDVIISMVKNYEVLLDKYHRLDFSSLLKIVYEGLIHEPQFQEMIKSELRYLIVDEYQDTNTMQEKVISGLIKVCAGKAAITVVGDDDQAIYGWNNTRIENRISKSMKARSFQKHEDGDVLALEFTSSEEEAAWIADKIQFFEGYPYQLSSTIPARGLALSDMAVLLRTKAQSEAIIEAFDKQGIRYQFKGNIGLISGSKLGQALASIFYYLAEKKDTDLVDVIHHWKEAALGIPSKQIEQAAYAIAEFKEAKLIEGYSNHASWAPQRALHLFLAELSLNEDTVPQCDGKSLLSSGEQTFWLIGQFSTLIAKFESVNAGRKNITRYYNSLSDYLEFAADDTFTSENQMDQEYNAVSILTIHASKGLEWPVVFMPGMGRNRFPLKPRGGTNIFHIIPEIAFKMPEAYKTPHAEERRLAFVAMTRAEKFLFMSWALGVPKGLKKNGEVNYGLYSKSSDFFNEVILGHDNYVLRRFYPELYVKERLVPSPTERILNHDFSFSSVFECRGCPYAYKLRNIFGLTPYYNEAIGFGQVLHNCVHDYHEQRRRDGKIWSDSELEEVLKKHFYLPFTPAPDLRLKLYMSALSRFKSHHVAYQVMAGIEYLEKEVSLFVNGNRLDGRLDMLRTVLDDKLEIIDFKSAEHGTHDDPSETIFQLRCYALAHLSNTGKKPDYIKPIYIESKLGSKPHEPIPVMYSDLEETEKELKGYVSGIKGGVMPKKPCSPLQCGKCDVAAMCRKGRASIKEKLMG